MHTFDIKYQNSKSFFLFKRHAQKYSIYTFAKQIRQTNILKTIENRNGKLFLHLLYTDEFIKPIIERNIVGRTRRGGPRMAFDE